MEDLRLDAESRRSKGKYLYMGKAQSWRFKVESWNFKAIYTTKLKDDTLNLHKNPRVMAKGAETLSPAIHVAVMRVILFILFP